MTNKLKAGVGNRNTSHSINDQTTLSADTQGEMGNTEILASLLFKRRYQIREIYLVLALNECLIKYTLSNKPNNRLQMYRSTGKRCHTIQYRTKRWTMRNEKHSQATTGGRI